MTTRRQRHVSPEKNLTIAERLQRVDDERAHIEAFDRERELQPGQLTPRQRIALLVDEGSFLEIGAFAKSQHHEVATETPADGVIVGYAEIGGRRAVVIAEDPIALANSDAQVGKNKRNRMLSNAIYRRLPIVYIADGTSADVPEFDAHGGVLLSRVAEQLPARDVAEREAPLVTVACGLCAGQNGSLAVRSDLLVATDRARFGAQEGSAESVADLVCETDAEAVGAAQRFLATLPAELESPLAPMSDASHEAAHSLTDEDMYASPREQADAIFDAGSVTLLGPAETSCAVGVAQVEGVPVAFALTGGSPRAALTTADLKRIARAASWSADYQIPFLSTQDTLGYDLSDAGTGRVHVRRRPRGRVLARLARGEDHDHHGLGLRARRFRPRRAGYRIRLHVVLALGTSGNDRQSRLPGPRPGVAALGRSLGGRRPGSGLGNDHARRHAFVGRESPAVARPRPSLACSAL